MPAKLWTPSACEFAVPAKNVPSAGLAIVAVIMSVQVLATMSPSASEQFGKIASIAVIMTLLPYIYSCIAIKVLGYGKMPHGQYSFFVAAGLAGAVYCMVALVGSDGEQTRWSLIFVIATIVFYSVSITRKRDLEEKHLRPGGSAPVWVRYLALGVTMAALAVMFWLSVGRRDDLNLRPREEVPASAGQSAYQMAPSGAQ